MFEFGEFLLVVAGNPAGFREEQWCKVTFCAILMFEPEADDVELEFSNSPNDFPVSGLLYKELSHTFFGKLPNAFVELLRFEKVLVYHLPEDFRGEAFV